MRRKVDTGTGGLFFCFVFTPLEWYAVSLFSTLTDKVGTTNDRKLCRAMLILNQKGHKIEIETSVPKMHETPIYLLL